MKTYEKMNELGEKIITLKTVCNIMESIQDSYLDPMKGQGAVLNGIESMWYMTRHLKEDNASCGQAMDEAFAEFVAEERKSS